MAKAWVFAALAAGLAGIGLHPSARAGADSRREHELKAQAAESARLAGIQSWRRLRRQKESEREKAREAFLKRRRSLQKSPVRLRRRELKKAWEKKQLLEKALAARARAEHIRQRDRLRGAQKAGHH